MPRFVAFLSVIIVLISFLGIVIPSFFGIKVSIYFVYSLCFGGLMGGAVMIMGFVPEKGFVFFLKTSLLTTISLLLLLIIVSIFL